MIFSVRMVTPLDLRYVHETEFARATVEVSRSLMQVVQFRTLLNAAPNEEQRRALNRWAGDKRMRSVSNAYTRWA